MGEPEPEGFGGEVLWIVADGMSGPTQGDETQAREMAYSERGNALKGFEGDVAGFVADGDDGNQAVGEGAEDGEIV